MNLKQRLFKPDALAIGLLVILWIFFFWRLFTPIQADQASLKQGDFSAQFVTFGSYQSTRWSQGQVPLWNPYNNGGLPFIADTQAAVFYPPRLLTIALGNLTGTGWTYHALELEMTEHILLYTLTMYWLVRRMTGSVFGGLIAAVVGGYGGYMSGYPPLQLALLEAGVWLPLAVLGIYMATIFPDANAEGETSFSRVPTISSFAGTAKMPSAPPKLKVWGLVLSGFVLGISWMAGHPQTSFFLTYLLIAYFAYRVYQARLSWRVFVFGTALFGVIAIGVVAVTLFPGTEYLLRTSRSDLGFDAKGNGFPYQDIIQTIFPGIVSLFSPLYIGITGLVLALIAVWKRYREVWFWVIVVIFALALSVGANGALYPALYNLLPGLRFFRGQERAAYLVAHSAAILAGFGAAYLMNVEAYQIIKRLRRAVGGLALLCLGITMLVFVLWLDNRDSYGAYIRVTAFSTLIAFGLFVIVPFAILDGKNAVPTEHKDIVGTSYILPLPTFTRADIFRWLVLILLVFELFSVNQDAPSTYEAIPANQQLSRNPLLDIPLADTNLPFRVDGLRVLGGNFGSLYGLADIQGISPLFLTSVQTIIEYGLPDEIAWELFAVRYVYSDWDALNVPGVVLGTGKDELGKVNLHQLTAPRPYALLMYDALILPDDAAAHQQLANPDFQPRQTIILNRDPQIELSGSYPDGAGATIVDYQPEYLKVITNTPVPAVLSLAHVDYPGWYATVNGQPSEILRAYGGLSAVVIPAGESTIELVFNPLSYRIGAMVSLITWGGLLMYSVILLIRRGLPHDR